MQTKSKTLGIYLGILFSLPIIFTGCGSDDNKPNPLPNGITPPTAQQFKALKDKAIESRTQNFTINTDAKGTNVSLSIVAANVNGTIATGDLDVEFIELYTKADLLLTNICTVGKHPNGDLEMLVTGGAFYVNISKDGEKVDVTNSHLSLNIPTSLTGGLDSDMVLWTGSFDNQENLIWEEFTDIEFGGVQKGEDFYHLSITDELDWINCDRFWDDPRPKTSLTFSVPQGYNSSNSAVFISFDGVLGILRGASDIPIGAECNVIFVSESNGKWVYAIQPYTIVENGTIQIGGSDLNIATEAELIALINALP